MPLTALIRGTKSVVEAQEAITNPKRTRYQCRYCGIELRLKRPYMRLKEIYVREHFFHVGGECASDFEGHPESYDHMNLKAMLRDSLLESGRARKVLLEEPIRMPWRLKGRKADLVSYDGISEIPEVWEIQLAPITRDEIEERTKDYVKAGYEPHWLLGKIAASDTNCDLVRDLLGECPIINFVPVRTAAIGILGQSSQISEGDLPRSEGSPSLFGNGQSERDA